MDEETTKGESHKRSRSEKRAPPPDLWVDAAGAMVDRRQEAGEAAGRGVGGMDDVGLGGSGWSASARAAGAGGWLSPRRAEVRPHSPRDGLGDARHTPTTTKAIQQLGAHLFDKMASMLGQSVAEDDRRRTDHKAQVAPGGFR